MADETENLQAGSQPGRGRLKIFLGYAPGVGKTYAMLDAGRHQREGGADVCIAGVETHHQPTLEALVSDFETLPAKLSHRFGGNREGFDVDLVLSRHPQLVLIDGLAASNPRGERHPKRYQDIEDILQAGINVYTTLDVYQLESLVDIVRQITGVTIVDTIPDRVFDQADEVELVDLSPDELMQRYHSERVAVSDEALQRLFRKGNLTALRELALRRAAGRVDAQMLEYMKSEAIAGPWPASERLLVAISSHPLSERLVRTGGRLADALNAEWYVVYVETPDRLRFSPAHNERLMRTLRLAEDLGAKVMTLQGQSVSDTIVTFARDHNVTKIIAGKPQRPQWMDWLGGSPIEDLIRKSGPIDVYVISDTRGPMRRSVIKSQKQMIPWLRYGQSLALVTGVTLLAIPIHNFVDPANLVMLYLAAVVFSAYYLGRGPSMLASFLSVVAFDFFFVKPHLSLSVTDTQYLLTFFGLLAVGAVISNLVGLVRDQVESSREREAQTATLYALGRDLTVAPDLDAILQAIIGHIRDTLSREVGIFLPEGGTLTLRSASPDFVYDEAEQAVARWAFDHAQEAGRGTVTHADARARYQPLKTAEGVIGILAVRPTEPGSYLKPDQRRLLEGFASLSALSIERARLAEQANQTQVLRASEKFQTALLNSISHDLRTPLASITGVLSSLRENLQGDGSMDLLDHETRLDLIETASGEAERLNRLVGNLLDMTRLEGGALKVVREPCDIQDVIGSALAQMRGRLKDLTVHTEIPLDLPLASADFVLIHQVLSNLIDNAVKYSPPHSIIDISAGMEQGELVVTVADQGRGVPPEDLERIFEKFYRGAHPELVRGTGLGLSIARGIIEAHGGRIWAENRPGGGTRIRFTLPVDEPPEGREDER